MKFLRPILLLLALLTAMPLFARIDFFSDREDSEVIEALAEQMSPTEKIGQMLVFGFHGATPSEDILSLIRDYHVGSVKLFGWNAEDLHEMVDAVGVLQQTALENPLQIPLIIATDQEGGWVRHIRGQTSTSAGNLALGATRIPFDAWYTGYYIGMELKMLGLSMNFAPTVDVYMNPDCVGIGPRSFSSDPALSAELSVAYYRGLDAAGVIATAKHFPGHGNADSDSHGVLPVLDLTLEELYAGDLVPYSFLFREELPSVMSGHLAFPRITEEIEPASLSHFFSTELLRDQMGYEGVLITDDLLMNGARISGYSFPQIALRAVMSGADMILFSQPASYQYQICELFAEEYDRNPDFRERVEESLRRVLQMKLRYLKGEDSVPLFPERSVVEELPVEGAREFFDAQAARATTWINGEPLETDEGSRVLITGQLPEFLEEGLSRFPSADTYQFDYTPIYRWNTAARQELYRLAPQYDQIIVGLLNYNSLSALMVLEYWADKVSVISGLNPVYLEDVPWVQRAVAVYGMSDESFQAGFAALSGDFVAGGVFPLSFGEN